MVFFTLAEASEAIASNKFDAVVFGHHFTSNPTSWNVYVLVLPLQNQILHCFTAVILQKILKVILIILSTALKIAVKADTCDIKSLFSALC